MGEQLYFERFIWFDDQVRKGKDPIATSLAEKFECDKKLASVSESIFATGSVTHSNTTKPKYSALWVKYIPSSCWGNKVILQKVHFWPLIANKV